jgi:hypothetical protein
MARISVSGIKQMKVEIQGRNPREIYVSLVLGDPKRVFKNQMLIAVGHDSVISLYSSIIKNAFP